MISIIVPFKNAAPWIKRCADSLAEQDGDIEVIFVNDHSEDGSDDIVHEYEALFLQVDNQHAPGVSGARNTGLDYCHGDWICFLDADDEYAPTAINAINASIRMYSTAQIIQLNHVRVTASGTIPRMFNPRGKYDLHNMPRLWASSCNKVFAADLVKDIRFIEGLNHGEDELFVLECMKRTRVLYNSEHVALYYHKDNPNSLSTTTSFDDLIGEQRALLTFMEQNRTDADMCFAVKKRQQELWSNAVYNRTFGG